MPRKMAARLPPGAGAVPSFQLAERTSVTADARPYGRPAITPVALAALMAPRLYLSCVAARKRPAGPGSKDVAASRVHVRPRPARPLRVAASRVQDGRRAVRVRASTWPPSRPRSAASASSSSTPSGQPLAAHGPRRSPSRGTTAIQAPAKAYQIDELRPSQPCVVASRVGRTGEAEGSVSVGGATRPKRSLTALVIAWSASATAPSRGAALPFLEP